MPQSANLPPSKSRSPPSKIPSRFLLGFPLKLSHAPLQVSCPQNHKIVAFIKSVLSASLISKTLKAKDQISKLSSHNQVSVRPPHNRSQHITIVVRR
jgi:hypothetical protein